MERVQGQLWGYIVLGEDGIARARFEASTDKPLLVCDSSRVHCIRGCKLLRRGEDCSLIEAKGGPSMAVEAVYAVEVIASSPPAYARLPVLAENPYLPLETQLIVDGPPRTLVFGLLDRYSNVITYTMRTILEGTQAPQMLVTSKDDEIIDRAAIASRRPEALLFQYPVMGPLDQVFDNAKLCEYVLGTGFWPRCYHDALITSRMKGAARRVVEDVITTTTELEKTRFIWVLSRIYASAAYMSRVPCQEFARRVYEAGSLLLRANLVFERPGERVLVVKTRAPLRLLLREPVAHGAIVYDQVVWGEALFSCACMSVAYFCETCWEPIT